ncbi:hypothetical protein DFO61_2897 [Ectopseudomonas oleovorans]|uniref:Uncharacterized protein n=1 Tax=Ectopseudomonas oleovorans TaxID=301 RepID=A0A397MFC4_ECTOL|nr:hypothetical protein [Pseudomonas oleovorans]RIA22223.1 hypothetical protein DFO61_2897 [Pseudomonas oleovorans]
MQSQEIETVAPAELNEQADTHERQPYQVPQLVKLNLAETLTGPITLNDGGAGLS